MPGDELRVPDIQRGGELNGNCKYRCWCFTLNNYLHPLQTNHLLQRRDDVTYLCFQPERGANGTRHLQGFVCFSIRKTLVAAKRYLCPSAPFPHLERMRGTPKENWTYCSKAESRDAEAGFGFSEVGEFESCPSATGQGARNDLGGVVSAITSGTCIRDVATAFPCEFIKYSRGIREYESLVRAPARARDELGEYPALDVRWYHGVTGTGKTRSVYTDFVDVDVYVKPAGPWFDGYIGQNVAVLDDFRADWFSFGFLLRVLDRYPLQVPVKGSFIQWSPKIIIVTCPVLPEVLYSNLENQHEGSTRQLIRRIDTFRLFGEPDAVPALAPIFNR